MVVDGTRRPCLLPVYPDAIHQLYKTMERGSHEERKPTSSQTTDDPGSSDSGVDDRDDSV